MNKSLPRRLKITGGPAPADVRIIDVATEADITGTVHGLKIHGVGGRLLEVELRGFAEVDLEAENADAPQHACACDHTYDEKTRTRILESIDHLRAEVEKALASGGRADCTVQAVLATVPGQQVLPTGGAIWQIVVTPGPDTSLELARLVVKRAEGAA